MALHAMNVFWLMKRDEFDVWSKSHKLEPSGHGPSPQLGTPYGHRRKQHDGLFRAPITSGLPECPIRLADGAYLEVVRPSAQRAVHLAHQLCGFLPCPRSVCQCMDLLNHALDALLRWPVSQARLTGSRRIHSSERVAQEVELPFRDLADSCLLLVDRELQLSHDLAQLLQCLIGIAFLAQDHEIVGIGHDTTAEALLQPELLPSQYEPAHVYIRQ